MIVRSVRINKKNLSLVDDDYSIKDNNYTILVGSNGTGKSRILKRIVNGLRNNNNLNKTVPMTYGEHLELDYDGEIFSVFSSSSENNSYIRKDKRNSGQVDVRCNVIAVTTTPFDRFPVSSKSNRLRWIEDSENYKYIGLKTSKNVLSESNLIDLLAKSMLTNPKIFQNTKLFDLLGLIPECIIDFKSKITTFIPSENVNYYDYFINQLRIKHASLYSNSELEKDFLDRVYSAFLDYCEIIHRPSKSGAHSIGFVLSNGSSNLPVNSLVYLIDLGIISISKVSFVDRLNALISLSDLSSGQKCMILTLLNIAGSIRNGSVICIDEPELSLHPKWQLTYMKVLMEFFKGFNKCHFIIATHSPLIVSELSDENCFVLNVDKGISERSTNYQHMSSDFQLVEVFGMAGNNNEYLNRVVVTLLSKLSKMGTLDNNDQKKLEKIRLLSESLEDDDDVKSLINLLVESWEKVSIDA